ncbi:hypothetical protein EC957_009922 [Mortierella hygrophila]|uniref:Crinkler effector protein N-terminal domain-containing protein n=1 Tax=Mortierella hygrophila TaxID=979708 RepID=A0A9P6JXN2_9FUNG|nr:hypothetical protein EC957_009922 [Mortierella hygrophila]
MRSVHCACTVRTPVPARVSTPRSGHISDESRSGTPPIGTEHAKFLQQPHHTWRARPEVLRRGVVESQDSKPNLLFLNLLDNPPSVGLPIPERFRTKVLLCVLDKMQAEDLPVFGVSGCGKTRSMIEMLCLQWGFYFNAAKSDFGLDDLCRLADFIDNNVFERKMGLSLAPSCLNMLEDMFAHFCMKLRVLTKERKNLASIVRQELEWVRGRLAACSYVNFSNESKVRVVIDEAQILSDIRPTSFASSSSQGDQRLIDTVNDLKDHIKTKISDTFNGVDAKDLTLWRVSIPDDDGDDEVPIVLDNVDNKDKKKLRSTRGLSEVSPSKPPNDTIHVIVQRPPPVAKRDREEDAGD